ncbi:hypothetical protein [Streptomyces hygroscopicus]|uniref:hypothetical protein n=1 Tax=Streptomyces hygroscopicus TaxID=1912 RepID=UPI001FCBCD80|nr:hypothetical protein HOK021_34780 [Streptomyces hygroscopicus]
MPHRKAIAASVLVAAAALLVPADTPAMATATASGGGADRNALQQALDATVAAGVPGAVAEVRDGRGVWRGVAAVGQPIWAVGVLPTPGTGFGPGV